MKLITQESITKKRSEFIEQLLKQPLTFDNYENICLMLRDHSDQLNVLQLKYQQQEQLRNAAPELLEMILEVSQYVSGQMRKMLNDVVEKATGKSIYFIMNEKREKYESRNPKSK